MFKENYPNVRMVGVQLPRSGLVRVPNADIGKVSISLHAFLPSRAK